MTSETNNPNQAVPDTETQTMEGEHFSTRESGDLAQLRQATGEYALATADAFLAEDTTHVEIEIPRTNSGYDKVVDEEGEAVQVPVRRNKSGKLEIVRDHPVVTGLITGGVALGTLALIRFTARNNKK